MAKAGAGATMGPATGTVLTPKHKPMTKEQIGVSESHTALARLEQDMLEDGKQVPFILTVKEA